MTASGLDRAWRAVQDYVEAWNEPDEGKRRALLERSWADGAAYTDPAAHVEGREALIAHSRRFAERWPGAVIELTSGVEEHHGRLRFYWVVRSPSGETLRDGVDFAELGEDGRIRRVVGFFGPPPPAPAAATELRQSEVTVGGVPTRYWEGGRGAPLVLIHGGGAGADAWGVWSGCAPALAAHFRVIAYDMVGFGGSLPKDPGFVFSQDARTRHLEGFLDELGLERAAIVGNSMGGTTALGLAMLRPERVARLVLAGSGGLTQGITPALAKLLSYTEADREAMWRIARALTHPSFEPAEELVEYRYQLTLSAAVMEAFRATMAWVREAGGVHYDEAEVAKVAAPTLIVSGRDDQVIPLSRAIRMNELIDTSWLYVIPRCGHWAMAEHPEDFTATVLRFLAGPAAATGAHA